MSSAGIWHKTQVAQGISWKRKSIHLKALKQLTNHMNKITTDP